MKIYNCDVCKELVYFENTLCINCHSPLGYLPVLDNMSSLEFVSEGVWKTLAISANGALYKKCYNYHAENVCNWMIPQEVDEDFCLSCRLNEVIPNLTIPENVTCWHRLEIAKRRLIYSLLRLNLPFTNKKDNPEKGLAFSFLADSKKPQLKETKKVMIGHDEGKITINIAEADDAVREKMRLNLNERYRTLLGHFRHEIGHYYWFLLIENDPDLLLQFRAIFGDEQEDYNKALKRHYVNGASADWHEHYVSAYASSHPWEDWAESWAHFLHMFDTLETANAWGLTVDRQEENSLMSVHPEENLQSFEDMGDQWVSLSTALNSLNRSMGMKDIYPFVWSKGTTEKLRFIQQVVFSFRKRN